MRGYNARRMLIISFFSGCGACKSAKEPFFQASEEISEDLPDTKLGIFNADEHKSYAKKLEVTVSVSVII